MLTVTNDTLLRLMPEQFGWLVLATFLPPMPGELLLPTSHAFEPIGGWSVVPTPAPHLEEMVDDDGEALPMTTYRDPSGTVVATIAEDGDMFAVRIDGDGWSIANGDLDGDGWQRTA